MNVELPICLLDWIRVRLLNKIEMFFLLNNILTYLKKLHK